MRIDDANVTVRPYREPDIATLAALFTESVHTLASAYYDESQLAAWAPRPPDLPMWRHRLSSVRTLVAEVDAHPVGFISYEENGHIDLLYTSPAHARMGIATTLYSHTEALLIAHGVTEAFTEASLVARPFFERRGFEVTEEQYVQFRGVTFQRFAMRKALRT